MTDREKLIKELVKILEQFPEERLRIAYIIVNEIGNKFPL